MKTQNLPHYVRMYRKKSGLTQEDISKLLSIRSRSVTSEIESSRKIPKTNTAVALSIILGVPLDQLLIGIYTDIRQEVVRNAELLVKEIGDISGQPKSRKARRLQALKDIMQ